MSTYYTIKCVTRAKTARDAKVCRLTNVLPSGAKPTCCPVCFNVTVKVTSTGITRDALDAIAQAVRLTHCHSGGAASSGAGCHAGEPADGAFCECECAGCR